MAMASYGRLRSLLPMAGHPAERSAPNHYRLLGVELFEANADAIENAADQRMTHVRSFQTGKYSDLSQKLLNEIAAAKICLLMPRRGPLMTSNCAQRLFFLEAETEKIRPKRTAYHHQSRHPSSDKQRIWLGLGLFAGAALVLAIVLIVNLGRGGKEVASTELKPPPARNSQRSEVRESPPAGRSQGTCPARRTADRPTGRSAPRGREAEAIGGFREIRRS